MLSALRLTVIGLLASKKFVMAVLTVVAGLAAKYGLGFDPAQALALLSPMIAAIIGQGIADHGKEAAMINASATAEAAKPPSLSTQGGFVSQRVLIGLALFGLAGVGACAWLTSTGNTVKTAAVDCTKGELGTAVKMFSPMLDQVLALATGGDGKIDTAQVDNATRKLVGDIGGCVMSTTFAKALHPTPPAPGAPQSSPLEIDPIAAREYFDGVRASRFGGKTFETEAGPL